MSLYKWAESTLLKQTFEYVYGSADLGSGLLNLDESEFSKIERFSFRREDTD